LNGLEIGKALRKKPISIHRWKDDCTIAIRTGDCIMSFDWKSLGGLLAKQGLPILANAIIPGSGTVVALITNALGLSHDASPQDIATAINSNPDNIVKLKELQISMRKLLYRFLLLLKLQRFKQ